MFGSKVPSHKFYVTPDSLPAETFRICTQFWNHCHWRHVRVACHIYNMNHAHTHCVSMFHVSLYTYCGKSCNDIGGCWTLRGVPTRGQTNLNIVTWLKIVTQARK